MTSEYCALQQGFCTMLARQICVCLSEVGIRKASPTLVTS